jgi:SAM-dependent methyltransferase
MSASVTTAPNSTDLGLSAVLPGELLCEAVDVHPSEKVLDVASAGGAAGLAAARRGGAVIVTDRTGEQLSPVQRLAGAYGVVLATEVAAVEDLPFADDSFDVVLSVFGAAFVPDQQRVADELVRVCRPSGRIGMANWVSGSLIGDVLRAAGRHVPSPAGRRPTAWGSEDRVRELFGNRVNSLHCQSRPFTFRFRTPDLMIDWLVTGYRPTKLTFDRLDPDVQPVLAADLAGICSRYNRADDGTFAAPSVYVEVVAVVR